MALRDMRLTMLVLCPAKTLPSHQQQPRLRTVWSKSFTTMPTRLFFEHFVYPNKSRRYWSANDTARTVAEPPIAAGWRVVLFDPKHDLGKTRNLPFFKINPTSLSVTSTHVCIMRV
jgi:hypothetical protein